MNPRSPVTAGSKAAVGSGTPLGELTGVNENMANPKFKDTLEALHLLVLKSKGAKGKVRKDIMNGRLEKRSGDGSWKAHGFYVHSTILCYYLEDQDGVEDAPHASMNLLSVEKVDTKMKDGRKVVRLWIDEKKKVELRQAPKDGDKDDASIDKWEQAFTAFVEQAKTNGARQKYIDDHKPKSRMRRMSESVEMTLFGAPEDPQANLNALAKAGIIEFYKAHNPSKLKDVDGLIESGHC